MHTQYVSRIRKKAKTAHQKEIRKTLGPLVQRVYLTVANMHRVHITHTKISSSLDLSMP